MFRRKEESLFDTATDANYNPAAPADSGSATNSGSATANNSGSNATSGTSGSATSGSTSSSTGSTGAVSRPLPDSRPASSTSSSNFRPNASPIGSEITRNRLPETKTTTQAPSIPGVVVDKSNKSGRRVLTVGNDILLKGEIATCDRLVIEGKVDATLNDVHTVEIAENGSFKGSAQIEDAEISGLFEGDLIVRNRLVIYATGKVRGKITYGEIEIERGGELTGEIKTVSSAGTQGTRSARPAAAMQQKEPVAA